MDIRILHIDDEQDVLEGVKGVLQDEEVSDHTLKIVDSCGFDEGLLKLETIPYDLVILDLCTGKASDEKDKVGEEVFKQIQERVFIPVIFFTGLPAYVEPFISDIVRVVGKGLGYDDLFAQIKFVLDSGFLKIKKDVEDVVREGVRSYFWNFVHKNSGMIASLKEDDVSLNYLLLRRLGKTLSSELTRTSVEDPKFKKDNSHPMEFYIYPPLDGEYETGDIVQSKADKSISIILTPACDLVARPGTGKRKADKVLLVHTELFKSMPDFISMKALYDKQIELAKSHQPLAKAEGELLNKLQGNLKALMKPGGSERYFFLPGTPFLDPLMVDFQHKSTITYEALEQGYDMVATMDDPFSQALHSKYTRYYSRVGYRDLDTDYAFSKMVNVNP